MSDPRRNAEGCHIEIALGTDKIIVSLEQLLTKEVTLS